MSKKVIVVSAFAVVAIFASYAVSDAQFGPAVGAPSPARLAQPARDEDRRETDADFAKVVHQLKVDLSRRLVAMPEQSPKDLELMKALDKYLADDKLDVIIRQLEDVKATFPGTNEANKAEGAIQILRAGVRSPAAYSSPFDTVAPRRNLGFDQRNIQPAIPDPDDSPK